MGYVSSLPQVQRESKERIAGLNFELEVHTEQERMKPFTLK